MNNTVRDQTPPEIDTQLSKLHMEATLQGRYVASLFARVHHAIGERTNGRRQWPTSDREAETALRSRLAAGEKILPHVGRDLLANLDTALRELAAIRGRMDALDAEYVRRGGWARFFIVQNSNGHIHTGMNCGTCRPSTSFGWLPDLSGLTEADAVKAHGPLLCSVCFPSAPSEWTAGKPKPARCAGSGHEATARQRHGMRTYGDCRECGQRGQLTPNGVVRAHPPAPKVT
jgi:hypothetical protein